MKKLQYLPILLVAVFLMLCACAQTTTEQPETTLTTIPSPIPTTVPTEPTTIPTQPTTAPTQPTTAPTQPTAAPTQPTTAPTQPTTKPTPPPTEPNWDWVTNREIVPFEERFVEDVPFDVYSTTWLVQQEGNEYLQYRISKRKGDYPLAVLHNNEVLYETVPDRDLSNYSLVGSDGHWVYLTGDNQLIRMDLLTGESTTLTEFSPTLLRWYVWACGKDTACIYTLDQDYLLHYFYLDFHTGATKDLYKDTIPVTPLEDMTFYRPGSTQGRVLWKMMNPAFLQLMQQELSNPESPFRNQYYYTDLSKYWDNPEQYELSLERLFFLSCAIQEQCDIPARVKYYYYPTTGELIPDYGIICSCERGTGQGHDHFNYDITASDVPDILDVAPVEVPNLTKLTPEQTEVALNTNCTFWSYYDWLQSDFGHLQPYVELEDGVYSKISDIFVVDMVIAADYAYCITIEGTIVQLSLDGQICNTIYDSGTTPADLCYWQGCLYFTDNQTIHLIDTINGTYRPILQTELINIYINGEYSGGLYFGVAQGMYCQEYLFFPDTGVLEEESYI